MSHAHHQRQDPCNLQELLERIHSHSESRAQVSVHDILLAVGERSFGPVVLVAGLIIVAPLIGDIPGVPTLMALLVVLTLGQRLFRRHSIWLPGKLARRSLARDKLLKGLQWAQKPAAFIDRWTKPRLAWLVTGAGQYLMALVCMVVALATPLMELIPFSATGGGLALAAFGLSMVAKDGLLALFALVVTGGTGWFIVANLPW
ncbi:MAG: exopolysaccharide biosynthesis protein [Alteromonadaceae bacterium]|nr:exopolysaccharide biosynthesis protein [Alteromonadaceae bacterium]